LTARPFITQASDRVRCLRQGHDWVDTQVQLGETVLMRSECERCNKVGRVQSTRHHSDRH